MSLGDTPNRHPDGALADGLGGHLGGGIGLGLGPAAAALAAGLDLAELLVQVVEAVDVQDAVEVVDLVLQRLAEEAFALEAHVAALAVLRLDGDGPGALDV